MPTERDVKNSKGRPVRARLRDGFSNGQYGKRMGRGWWPMRRREDEARTTAWPVGCKERALAMRREVHSARLQQAPSVLRRWCLGWLWLIVANGGLGGQEPGKECSEGGALRGAVADEITGVPLPGARVVASRQRAVEEGDLVGERAILASTETIADGSYQLCRLPFGTLLEIRASAAGRKSQVGEVRLLPGRTQTLEFVIALSEAAPGAIVGQVTDRDSGRPVNAASIALESLGGSEALHVASDRQGRFAIDVVPAGQYRLHVEHLGYGSVTDTLQVPSRRTVEVHAGLSPDPIELDPIVATVVRNPVLEMRGFYERKEWGEKLGTGHYFNREDIERRRPRHITHMVADLAGARLLGCTLRGCDAVRFVRSSPSCRRADMYVDGVLVKDAFGQKHTILKFDEYMVPSEVAGIEVYKGASSLPAGFGGAAGQCGAVLVWTRGGYGDP